MMASKLTRSVATWGALAAMGVTLLSCKESGDAVPQSAPPGPTAPASAAVQALGVGQPTWLKRGTETGAAEILSDLELEPSEHSVPAVPTLPDGGVPAPSGSAEPEPALDAGTAGAAGGASAPPLPVAPVPAKPVEVPL